MPKFSQGSDENQHHQTYQAEFGLLLRHLCLSPEARWVLLISSPPPTNAQVSVLSIQTILAPRRRRVRRGFILAC